MKFSIALALAASLLLAGCGTPVQHQTASGKTEAFFYSAPEVVKPKIIGMMVNHGFNLTKDTNYMVAFEKPVQNLMAAVLLGSKYDSTPNIRATFMFAPNGVNTRVILDYTIVTNPGSAFERLTPVNGNQDTAALQSELDTLAAQK